MSEMGIFLWITLPPFRAPHNASLVSFETGASPVGGWINRPEVEPWKIKTGCD